MLLGLYTAGLGIRWGHHAAGSGVGDQAVMGIAARRDAGVSVLGLR
jgi:flagellar biosynthesis/type III secretory pathway ATPase